ncbi:hypothetical protein CPB86DRAFT_795068 [Serendipita vermifera]|nr:hypothetical protein CPB86DRAFT_795068 [Serendipita vermifera]
MATANARAAAGGRSPVIGRDTRTQLFVGNLPYRVRWQDLKDLFRKAGGTVLRADVSLGPDNRSRGYGTVLLASAEDAGRAIDMFNGYVWQSRTLEVRPDRLPNDFDSHSKTTTATTIVQPSVIPPSATAMSPQSLHFPTQMAGPSSVPNIHPLSMQAAVTGALPPASTSVPSSLLPSLGSTIPIVSKAGTSATPLNGSILGMTTGPLDAAAVAFPNDTLRRSDLLKDMTRSPSAFKLPSTAAAASIVAATTPTPSSSLIGTSTTPVPGLAGAAAMRSAVENASLLGSSASKMYESARPGSSKGLNLGLGGSGKASTPTPSSLGTLPAGTGSSAFTTGNGLPSSLASSTYSTATNLNGVLNKEDLSRRTVLVMNWPIEHPPADFEQLFRSAGNVVSISFGSTSTTSTGTPSPNSSSNSNGAGESASASSTMVGFGSVVYATEEEASAAILQFNGCELKGKILSVRMGQAEQSLGNEPSTLTQLPHAPSGQISTMQAIVGAAANGSETTPYAYPAYMALPSPPAAGYIMTSPPGSPYDQYPPALAYVPVTSSASAGYPSTMNGATTAIPASSTTSAGVANGPVPNVGSPPASTTRIPPGTITLPNPSLTAYPPGQISPMHGMPPITPSMPSFSFVSQPMPTPPLHPHFLSPGLGPYSPLGSPGFYRPVNPTYFNLAPGAPVSYHHDPAAANSNGVIGSGAALTTGAVNALQGGGMMGPAMNGMGMGPVTPYFDMTAATAGSDAAQEYFPPMPITASLTSAIQSMSLSNNASSSSSVPTGTDSTGVSTASASGPSSTKEEEAPTFLEPVGVGRDGFPSLAAKASERIVEGPNEGVSRTGLTEWVTTPDDLPGGASLRRKKLEGRQSGPVMGTMSTRNKDAAKERSVSADQVTTLNSTSTPPSSSRGTTGSTSPPSGGSGPIYSSTKKPKLTLGPIPKFSPDARLAQHYASMAMNKGSNGGNGPRSPPSTAQLATRANSTVYGTGSGGGHQATGGVNNVLNNPGFAAAVGINASALKINGTPNGFRDSLNVDPETGAMRRASWTEDASRRQTIVQALGSEQAV